MQITTKYVGLDVSKEMIAVAFADAGREAPRSLGNIENTAEAIRRKSKRLDFLRHTTATLLREDGADLKSINRETANRLDKFNPQTRSKKIH